MTFPGLDSEDSLTRCLTFVAELYFFTSSILHVQDSSQMKSAAVAILHSEYKN